MSGTTPATRPPAYWAFFGLAAGLTTMALYWAFYMAPTEASMGIVQKIFFFHVPCAIAMQLLFVTSGFASMRYLYKPGPKSDRLAVACAEVGVVMAAFVLISGPLWARKAWGHYWEWEPRLTLTMVLCFMFAAYIALRAFGGDDPMTRRISAGLAVAGLPAIYLVRVAVTKWRGTHPRVVWRGGLTQYDMKVAFWLGVAGFASLAVVLVWERYRLEAMRNQLDELVLDMMERDLLEDEL